MTQLTIEQLTRAARLFLRSEYDLPLNIPISRNNRLRRSLGLYYSNIENEPLCIEISGRAMTYASDAVAVDIIKHECVHYAMHTLGKPFDDGHPEFEAELARHGIRNNYENNYDTDVGEVYVFTCNNCGDRTTSRLKRVLNSRGIGYISACCRAPMTYGCTEIYDGERLVTRK